MTTSVQEIKRLYPIHWLVWNNLHQELNDELVAKKFTDEEMESKDPRGRTPLMLAVTLGHLEATRVLLDAGADVNCEKDGWTAVQEATARGCPELLSLVLAKRDHQRHAVRACGVPELLQRLSLVPDFYVEMKWEFTSWVPLVSRMCPFDTYKVYKRGGNVRIDTTLVGFEQNRWQRGDRTYIFRSQGRSASLMELDHERGTSWCEWLEPEDDKPWPAPSPDVIAHRLSVPVAINYLDTDKISFERNKSGIWGWRQDKMETVNGYECKVFGASNVELVSKTRGEHLPRGEPRLPSPKAPAPLAGLLSLADNDPTVPLVDKEETKSNEEEAVPISCEEYFSNVPLADRDIGRPKEVTTKVQKFKATLWLSENYPLELQEQILPILDLMASMSSPHFAKLKDFVQMQLPAGFPIKIEIPLFHVLNARITFGNIFGMERAVPHVEQVSEGTRLSCLVDDACFVPPPGYRDAADVTRTCRLPEEDGLLQYAIHQSLVDAASDDDQVDVWEALRGARPGSPTDAPHGSPASPFPHIPPVPPAQPRPGHLTTAREILAQEETQLQRAIEASLASLSLGPGTNVAPAPPPEPIEDPDDAELRAVLELSAREQDARVREMLAEQRALDEALRLSLMEK